MRKTLARTTALAILLGLAAISSVQASSVYVQVGPNPPPPVRYQKPWVAPHSTAVWVPAHNEWRHGRYVWVSGYYTYPPRRNTYWVQPRYLHTPNGYYYRPGYWR